MRAKPISILRDHLVTYPTPITINYFWGFGSSAGLVLVLQLVSGLLLAMHYAPVAETTFGAFEQILRDMNEGWWLRFLHANGASLFFVVVYIHIARGLWNFVWLGGQWRVWVSGTVLFVLMMAAAFFGYVLPWGQMSFWGATVITNLFSAIPFIGDALAYWLWGGFSVANPTLNRFFVFHFVVPFLLAAFVIIHLVLLHLTGSTDRLVGIPLATDRAPFYPYFFAKDVVGWVGCAAALLFFVSYWPNALGHPDNAIEANPLVTPAHIVPEWYFLSFYAILRSITNKLLGVVAMAAALLVFIVLPLFVAATVSNWFWFRFAFSPLYLLTTGVFCSGFIVLCWVGAQTIEPVIVLLGQRWTFYYFGYAALVPGLLYVVSELFVVRTYSLAQLFLVTKRHHQAGVWLQTTTRLFGAAFGERRVTVGRPNPPTRLNVESASGLGLMDFIEYALDPFQNFRPQKRSSVAAKMLHYTEDLGASSGRHRRRRRSRFDSGMRKFRDHPTSTERRPRSFLWQFLHPFHDRSAWHDMPGRNRVRTETRTRRLHRGAYTGRHLRLQRLHWGTRFSVWRQEVSHASRYVSPYRGSWLYSYNCQYALWLEQQARTAREASILQTWAFLIERLCGWNPYLAFVAAFHRIWAGGVACGVAYWDVWSGWLLQQDSLRELFFNSPISITVILLLVVLYLVLTAFVTFLGLFFAGVTYFFGKPTFWQILDLLREPLVESDLKLANLWATFGHRRVKLATQTTLVAGWDGPFLGGYLAPPEVYRHFFDWTVPLQSSTRPSDFWAFNSARGRWYARYWREFRAANLRLGLDPGAAYEIAQHFRSDAANGSSYSVFFSWDALHERGGAVWEEVENLLWNEPRRFVFERPLFWTYPLRPIVQAMYTRPFFAEDVWSLADAKLGPFPTRHFWPRSGLRGWQEPPYWWVMDEWEREEVFDDGMGHWVLEPFIPEIGACPEWDLALGLVELWSDEGWGNPYDHIAKSNEELKEDADAWKAPFRDSDDPLLLPPEEVITRWGFAADSARTFATTHHADLLYLMAYRYLGHDAPIRGVAALAGVHAVVQEAWGLSRYAAAFPRPHFYDYDHLALEWEVEEAIDPTLIILFHFFCFLCLTTLWWPPMDLVMPAAMGRRWFAHALTSPDVAAAPFPLRLSIYWHAFRAVLLEITTQQRPLGIQQYLYLWQDDYFMRRGFPWLRIHDPFAYISRLEPLGHSMPLLGKPHWDRTMEISTPNTGYLNLTDHVKLFSWHTRQFIGGEMRGENLVTPMKEHGHRGRRSSGRRLRTQRRSLIFHQLQYNMGLAAGSNAHGLWAGHRAIRSHPRLRRHKLNSVYIWSYNRTRLFEKQLYYSRLRAVKGDFLALNDFLYPGSPYTRQILVDGVVRRISPLLLDESMAAFMRNLAVVRPRNRFDRLHDWLPAHYGGLRRFCSVLADYFGQPQWQHKELFVPQRPEKNLKFVKWSARHRGYHYPRGKFDSLISSKRRRSRHFRAGLRRIRTEIPVSGLRLKRLGGDFEEMKDSFKFLMNRGNTQRPGGFTLFNRMQQGTLELPLSYEENYVDYILRHRLKLRTLRTLGVPYSRSRNWPLRWHSRARPRFRHVLLPFFYMHQSGYVYRRDGHWGPLPLRVYLPAALQKNVFGYVSTLLSTRRAGVFANAPNASLWPHANAFDYRTGSARNARRFYRTGLSVPAVFWADAHEKWPADFRHTQRRLRTRLRGRRVTFSVAPTPSEAPALPRDTRSASLTILAPFTPFGGVQTFFYDAAHYDHEFSLRYRYSVLPGVPLVYDTARFGRSSTLWRVPSPQLEELLFGVSPAAILENLYPYPRMADDTNAYGARAQPIPLEFTNTSMYGRHKWAAGALRAFEEGGALKVVVPLEHLLSHDPLYRRLHQPNASEYLSALHRRYYTPLQLLDHPFYYFNRRDYSSPFLPLREQRGLRPPAVVDVWRSGVVVMTGRPVWTAPPFERLPIGQPAPAFVSRDHAELTIPIRIASPRARPVSRSRDAFGWSASTYRTWRRQLREVYYDRYHPFNYFDYYHHMPARSGLAPWTEGVFLLMLRRLHSTIDLLDWQNLRLSQHRRLIARRHATRLFFNGMRRRGRGSTFFSFKSRTGLHWSHKRRKRHSVQGSTNARRLSSLRDHMFFSYARRSTRPIDSHKRYAAFPAVGRFSSYWTRQARGLPQWDRETLLTDLVTVRRAARRRPHVRRIRPVNLRPFVDIHEALPIYGKPRRLTGVIDDPRVWHRLHRSRRMQLSGHWGRRKSDLRRTWVHDRGYVNQRVRPVRSRRRWWFGSIPHRGYFSSGEEFAGSNPAEGSFLRF